jgi:hypothetical protein
VLGDPALAESAKTWLTDDKRIWLDESEEAVVQGMASNQLVHRLATVPLKMRSNVLWRWVVRAVVAGLSVLSLALAVTAWLANDRDVRAGTVLRRAVSFRVSNDGLAMLKEERTGATAGVAALVGGIPP